MRISNAAFIDSVAKCVGASTFGYEFGNLTDIYALFGVMTSFCISRVR